jgi:hypothetical protein
MTYVIFILVLISVSILGAFIGMGIGWCIATLLWGAPR